MINENLVLKIFELKKVFNFQTKRQKHFDIYFEATKNHLGYVFKNQTFENLNLLQDYLKTQFEHIQIDSIKTDESLLNRQVRINFFYVNSIEIKDMKHLFELNEKKLSSLKFSFRDDLVGLAKDGEFYPLFTINFNNKLMDHKKFVYKLKNIDNLKNQIINLSRSIDSKVISLNFL